MSAVFDVDDVAIVTKDGLHKDTPVLIKKQCSTYKTPYNKDVFYDCETYDDPPRIIVVNEKDLISFEQYLDDVGANFSGDDDDDPLTIFRALEDILPELELEEYIFGETDSMKHIKCECGADKTQVGKHSTWCPKYG